MIPLNNLVVTNSTRIVPKDHRGIFLRVLSFIDTIIQRERERESPQQYVFKVIILNKCIEKCRLCSNLIVPDFLEAINCESYKC